MQQCSQLGNNWRTIYVAWVSGRHDGLHERPIEYGGHSQLLTGSVERILMDGAERMKQSIVLDDLTLTPARRRAGACSELDEANGYGTHKVMELAINSEVLIRVQ